jgi:LysR family hydrogen peroxide-inducible transcriptional activator
LNLRDLKYLVAVAEQRHFGRAAEACHVSQPTLSTQIRKLEEFLGVTLIERNNRQVLLTPIGEKIVEQARLVLRESEQLVKMAQQARDPFGGEFRLGIIPTVAPYLLPRILPAIREQFPDLEIQLIEAQTATITRELRAGRLDAIILALPVDEDGVRAAPLYAEPFYVALSPQHPLCGRNSITAEDLETTEVLLLEDGHCLRDQALDVCKQAGAVENTNFSATSIETLRHMVSANIGITLMPELAVEDDSKSIRYLPFEGEPPHRVIGMVWRGTTTREALLGKLAQMLRGLVTSSMPLSRADEAAGVS